MTQGQRWSTIVDIACCCPSSRSMSEMLGVSLVSPENTTAAVCAVQNILLSFKTYTGHRGLRSRNCKLDTNESPFGSSTLAWNTGMHSEKLIPVPIRRCATQLPTWPIDNKFLPNVNHKAWGNISFFFFGLAYKLKPASAAEAGSAKQPISPCLSSNGRPLSLYAGSRPNS